MKNLRDALALLLLGVVAIPSSQVRAAGAPYEIEIKELEKQKAAPAPPKAETKKHHKHKKGHSAASPPAKQDEPAASTGNYVRYTVKPGDHIFKILMVKFGMSNDEAERLVPEVARVNHISDIKKLRVGQTLLIPVKGKAAKAQGGKKEREEEAQAALGAASKLEAEGAAAATPAPAAPAAPAAAVPQGGAVPPPQAKAAQAPSEPVWVCAVTAKEAGKVVDDVLNALAIHWSRNKIIQSGENAPTAYSIRVDRYFEYKGGRYIISIGETDPYSYTLIRLLESSGYHTVTVGSADDFPTVADKVLKLVGVTPDFGRHPYQGGNVATGFLVQQEEPGGRKVLITADRVDTGQKFVLKPGCLAR